MSTATKYKCDFCGAEQTRPSQFWQILIAVRPYTIYAPFTISVDAGWKRAELCRKCAEKYGLLPSAKPQVEPQTETTIEDIVRRIVRDETIGPNEGT